MSVDFMVYAHYDVLSTPPTNSGPKPALPPLVLTVSSLSKLLRSMSQGSMATTNQLMYEHANARHLHLAPPVLMLPAKWPDRMSMRMLTK